MNDVQSVCQICCEMDFFTQSLQCECIVCVCCLSRYCKVKMENLSYKLEQLIECPGGCKTNYTLDNVLGLSFKNGIIDQIDSYLLKKYMISTQDIHQCPNKKCQYFGILPSDSCCEQLICEKCGNQWVCFELLPMKQKILKYLGNIYQTRQLMTDLNQILFSNACPQCGIPIYRNGGCTHMTCIKCTYQFCWLCKQIYGGHKELQCFIRFLAYYGIYLNMYFNILIYFNWHIVVLRIIYSIFAFIWGFLLHNVVVFFLGCFTKFSLELNTYLVTRQLNENVYQKKQRQNIIVSLILSFISLSSYIFIVTYFTEITLCSWSWYMIIQSLILLVVGGLGFASVKTIYFIDLTWLRHIM